MGHSTLKELPPPPPGKTGWPWNEESRQLQSTMPDGRPWPRVSIVTPSYNQGQFIEETIRSVLLQGYPDLEYIIIDGGSGDGTVDIIRKYEDKLAYWFTGPDKGQAHAINKGFKRATGEIFGWINSDDYYYPGVFPVIARAFVEHPEIALIHGYEHHVDRNGHVIQEVFPALKDARAVTFYVGKPLLQLTCFWRSEAHRDIGGLNEAFLCHMDYEFLLRLSYQYRSMYVSLCVGAFRRYHEQKSQLVGVWFSEYNKVQDKFLMQVQISAWKYQLLRCFYRVLALWRNEGASGLVRALRRRCIMK